MSVHVGKARRFLLAVSATVAIVFSLPALAQDAAPRFAGTAPELGFSGDDPSSFVVVGPGIAVPGNTATIRVENRSEGYRLDMPDLLPSSWVGEYEMRIVARDAADNETVRILRFNYNPPRAGILNMVNGEVRIPASTHAFRDNGGRQALTSDVLKDQTGTQLAGVHNLRAALRADSTIPIVINGVTLSPGEGWTAIGQHNFSGTGGRLSLPMAAAADGQVGVAHVAIVTSAPNTPVIEFSVRTWQPEVALAASSWSVRQAIEPITVTATVDGGCASATSVQTAKSHAIFNAPLCFFEWTSLPAGLQATQTRDGSLLQGRIWQPASLTLGWRVSVFDADGAQKVLATGSREMTVNEALGGMAFGFTPAWPSSAVQALQEFDRRLTQSGGPACSLTVSNTQALAGAASGSLNCLVEWTSLPSGFTQVGTGTEPRLKGSFAAVGEQSVGWRVSIVPPSGSAIPVAVGTSATTVAEPPAPVLAFSPDLPTVTDRLAVAPAGGRLGNLSARTSPGELLVTTLEDGAEAFRSTLSNGFVGSSGDAIARMEVRATPADVWRARTHVVKVAYAKLPSISSEISLTTLVLPVNGIKPDLTVASARLLRGDPIEAAIRIVDQTAAASSPYSAATMGEWKVRIVRQFGRDMIPVTDLVETSAGTATFTVPTEAFEDDAIRLLAYAEPVSPIAGYTRTEYSSRTVAITLLHRGNIPATLRVSRTVGVAPLGISVDAVPTDPKLRPAIGEVRWEFSTDEGTTWSPDTQELRNPLRITRTLDPGRHMIRASVVNAHDGTRTDTAAVEVTAVQYAQLRLLGGGNALAGMPLTLKAEATAGATTYPGSELLFEWSKDGGQTWALGGQEMSVTGEDGDRYRIDVRARFLNSPDVPSAWMMARSSAAFFAMRPPRINLSGPRAAEVGREIKLRANVSTPYRGLEVPIEGEWTLPDGSRSASPEIQWTPTDELGGTTATFAYTARLVEKPEISDTVTFEVEVWQYRWPEFRLDVIAGSGYAPSPVQLRLVPVGVRDLARLENVRYAWAFPSGVTLVAGADEKPSRPVAEAQVSVVDPGSYPISVTIRDDRGNNSVAEATVTLAEAPAYDPKVDVQASNIFKRAPLTVVLRPRVDGGHPYDRISTASFAIEGASVNMRGLTGIATLPQGTHEVVMKVATKLGRQIEHRETITVAPNQKPVCGIEGSDKAGTLFVFASCVDPDGRLAGLQWTLNGEPFGVSSTRVSFRRPPGDGAVVVGLTALDDSGDRSDPATFTFPPP